MIIMLCFPPHPQMSFMMQVGNPESAQYLIEPNYENEVHLVLMLDGKFGKTKQ